MAAKAEGSPTLHEQRNLSEDEIAERTKAKLKADEAESEKVREELEEAKKKTEEQAKKEAAEVKADEEKKEKEAKGAAPTHPAGHGPGHAAPGAAGKK